MPANTVNAIRNLIHLCHGNVCVRTTFTKQQVIEVVHSQNGMAVITVSVRGECCTAGMDRDEITVSVLEREREPARRKSTNKDMSNSMFVHVAVETFDKLRKEKRDAGVAKK